MARLWYRPTPADFVIGLGATAEMLDENEEPLVDEEEQPAPRFGRTALVPLTSDAFDVYVSPGGSPTTDLLDENSVGITQWVSSDAFATLGRGPAIQGPDEHEGPLFLSADGETFYRIEPDSDALYARVTALEEASNGGPGTISTGDLEDWSNAGRSDGDVPRWNESNGRWESDSPVGTGTVTSVAGVIPGGGGNVPTGQLRSALQVPSASDMEVIKERMYVLCRWTGSGYEPKPSGFPLAIRIGPQVPSSNVTDYDLWGRPREDD